MSSYFTYDPTTAGTSLGNLKTLKATNINLPQYAIGGDNRPAYITPSGNIVTDSNRLFSAPTITNLTATPVIVATVSSSCARIDIVLQLIDNVTPTITYTNITINAYVNQAGNHLISSNQSLSTPNAAITQTDTATVTHALPSGLILTWTSNNVGNLLLAGTALNSNNNTVNMRINITRI